MIIPIGHHGSAVRRLPWVTGALIGLCLVSFSLTSLEVASRSPARGIYFEQAADYFREHAYLHAQEEIREQVRNDVPTGQRSHYLPKLAELTLPDKPETPRGVAAEQGELDRLTARALGPSQPAVHPSVNPSRRGRLVPGTMTPRTLVSHQFMHASWLHLLGNMLLLFVLGPALESRWGRPLYASFYLTAGVFAGACYASLATHSTVPLVGASGAIAGVMGALLVRRRSDDLRFAVLSFAGFRPRFATFSAPAAAALPLWLAITLLSAWLAEASDIAYWANLGGFAFGAAIAAGARLAKLEGRRGNDRSEAPSTAHHANPKLNAALAACNDGDLETAFSSLREETERKPEEIDVGLAFWDVAVRLQRPQEAASALAHIVEQLALHGELELARRHWLELVSRVPTQLTGPATLLRLVPLLREHGDSQFVLPALRQVVDPNNRGLSAGMAMRAIDELGEADPAASLRAAQVALSNSDLHETMRRKLQALVAELEGTRVERAPKSALEEPERPRPALDEDGALDFDEIDFDAELEIDAPAPPPAGHEGTLAVLIDLPRFEELELAEAVPTRLSDDALYLKTSRAPKAKIEYTAFDAIAVAAAEGLGGKPVLLIDLLLNWSECTEGPLRAVRLRSDTFDARELTTRSARATDALREFAALLLERSGAVPLPDREAVEGRPFAVYESLADYEREVLQVER